MWCFTGRTGVAGAQSHLQLGANTIASSGQVQSLHWELPNGTFITYGPRWHVFGFPCPPVDLPEAHSHSLLPSIIWRAAVHTRHFKPAPDLSSQLAWAEGEGRFSSSVPTAGCSARAFHALFSPPLTSLCGRAVGQHGDLQNAPWSRLIFGFADLRQCYGLAQFVWITHFLVKSTAQARRQLMTYGSAKNILQ